MYIPNEINLFRLCGRRGGRLSAQKLHVYSQNVIALVVCVCVCECVCTYVCVCVSWCVTVCVCVLLCPGGPPASHAVQGVGEDPSKRPLVLQEGPWL